MFLEIKHQQNPFKDLKRASSKKIKGWGMELFYSLLSKISALTQTNIVKIAKLSEV